MTTVEVCLCILLVAGAFALICLGIFFIKSLSTLEELNHSMIEAQKTIESVNLTVDNVNCKLEALDALGDRVNGFFQSGSRLSLLGKATGLVGMYQVGKHRKSRNQKKRG